MEKRNQTRKKCRMGLDFLHRELIGWLWFAIGGSHVIDRLVVPPLCRWTRHHI